MLSHSVISNSFWPKGCSPPGSSVQARILEWVAISSPRGSSRPKDQTCTLARRFFTTEPPGKPMCISAAAAAKSLQSCPTLCNPLDGSPPGSPVPGILQARTLEWVAISSSNAWKWKVKVKALSRVRLLATPWTAAHQAPHWHVYHKYISDAFTYKWVTNEIIKDLMVIVPPILPSVKLKFTQTYFALPV